MAKRPSKKLCCTDCRAPTEVYMTEGREDCIQRRRQCTQCGAFYVSEERLIRQTKKGVGLPPPPEAKRRAQPSPPRQTLVQTSLPIRPRHDPPIAASAPSPYDSYFSSLRKRDSGRASEAELTRTRRTGKGSL